MSETSVENELEEPVEISVKVHPDKDRITFNASFASESESESVSLSGSVSVPVSVSESGILSSSESAFVTLCEEVEGVRYSFTCCPRIKQGSVLSTIFFTSTEESVTDPPSIANRADPISADAVVCGSMEEYMSGSGRSFCNSDVDKKSALMFCIGRMNCN